MIALTGTALALIGFYQFLKDIKPIEQWSWINVVFIGLMFITFIPIISFVIDTFFGPK